MKCLMTFIRHFTMTFYIFVFQKKQFMNRVVKFLFGKSSERVTFTNTAALTNCANCGAALSGPFCCNCGQKKEDKHDFKITHFLGETLHAFTHFDSKFFRSFKYLVLKPGMLTREYFAGHKKEYMHPLQLFLVINILYFLLLSTFLRLPVTFETPLKYQINGGWINHKFDAMVSEKIKSLGITYKEYETEFNHKTSEQAKTLIIIMIPFFALLLSFLFWDQRRYFVEHLAFSFHFFSFVLIFQTIGVIIIDLIYNLALLISSIFGRSAYDTIRSDIYSMSTENNSSTLVSIIFIIYLFIAFKKAYSASNFGSLVKAIMGVFCFWMIVFAYRWLLFYTTFYGLKLSLH